MKKQYLQHISGLTAFFCWLEQKNIDIKLESQIIYLPENLSKRFCIGVPKRKIFGTNVFLAVPSNELKWMANIIWKRAVIFPEKRMLFFISRKMNEEEYSTIPSFAIGFPFDSLEKAQILAHLKQIDIRGYWKERDELHIENGYRSRMPMKRWDGVILQPEEVSFDITFSDIIKHRIDESNRYIDPGYQGDKNDLSRVDQSVLTYMKDFLTKKEK